jgi:hypothetical protein
VGGQKEGMVGEWIGLMIFIHMYENRIMKVVKNFLKSGQWGKE